jgi:hypothetical protein
MAYLQELCSMLKEKYDGDATKLRVEGEDSIEKVKARVMQFKGIGTLRSQQTGANTKAKQGAIYLFAVLSFGGANYSRISMPNEAGLEPSN